MRWVICLLSSFTIKEGLALSSETSCSTGWRRCHFMAFSLAGYDLDRVKSFKARRVEKATTSQGARKRRLGTWQPLMGEREQPLVVGYATGAPAWRQPLPHFRGGSPRASFAASGGRKGRSNSPLEGLKKAR